MPTGPLNKSTSRAGPLVGSGGPPGHQSKAPLLAQKSYPGGFSTNWTAFYKPIKLNGLKLELQVPFYDVSFLNMKLFGLPIAWEDNIIIFKCNDEDTGVYILSGTGKITEEKLKNDRMFLEKLM